MIFTKVFGGIGLVLLTIAFVIGMFQRTYMSKALEAEGTVIGNDFTRSIKTGTGSGSYHPIVEYSYNGKVVSFRSSMGSNPSMYDVGEKVQVCFDPDDMKNAQIKNFFSQNLVSFILGSIGLIFFVIGGVFGLVAWNRNKTINWLLANGTRIEADFDAVKLNPLVKVNGRNPHQIHCHWKDKLTNTIYNFKSDNIYTGDPSRNMKTKLLVYIDPANPKKYYIDLSFLD